MSDSPFPQPSNSFDPSLQIQQELEGDRNQVIGQSVNSTVVSAEVVNLTVYDRPPILRRHLPTRTAKFSDNQDDKFKKVLLNKIKNYWIQGVLEKSLYNTVLIELRLEERVDAVQDPFNSFQTLPDESRKNPLGDRDVSDLFIEMGEGRSLLVLGEPGAGKTITLLRLAKELATHAEKDINYPIPVVFNLSSWIHKRQTISNWLIGELDSKYQVSRKLGKKWIENQRLLLLLDGLDEVKVDSREDCVQAINQFMQQYGQTEIVVCSRLKDYEVLSNRLNLQNAIYLQPLTIEQVNLYFDKAGDQLKTLKTLFNQDLILQKLAKSPLMLSVMSLAYQNELGEAQIEASSVEEYHQKLFDAYVKQMLRRWKAVDLKYSKDKFMNWLSRLALKMSQESQTIFLIEQIQPTWLQSQSQRIIYRIGLLLISGLVGGVGGGLSLGIGGGLVIQKGVLSWSLLDALSWFLVGALMGVLCGVVILGLSTVKIETVETLDFSWEKISRYLINSLTTYSILVSSVISALILGLTLVLVDRENRLYLGDNLILEAKDRLSFGLLWSLTFGLSFGIILGLINGLEGLGIETKIFPNQGIWRSVKNSILLGLLGGLVGGLVGGVFGGLIGRIYFESIPNAVTNSSLLFLLIFGLIFGLIGGLFNEASRACIMHFTLRLSLYLNDYFPWNVSRFLDYATECIFLQKVGGGYIFIHRMLLEYLAHQVR